MKIKQTYDALKYLKKYNKNFYNNIKKKTYTNIDIFDIEDEK